MEKESSELVQMIMQFNVIYYLSSFFNREKLKAETTFFSFVRDKSSSKLSLISNFSPCSFTLEYRKKYTYSYSRNGRGKWSAITNSLDFGGSSITKPLRFEEDASSETKRNNSGACTGCLDKIPCKYSGYTYPLIVSRSLSLQPWTKLFNNTDWRRKKEEEGTFLQRKEDERIIIVRDEGEEEFKSRFNLHVELIRETLHAEQCNSGNNFKIIRFNPFLPR